MRFQKLVNKLKKCKEISDEGNLNFTSILDNPVLETL